MKLGPLLFWTGISLWVGGLAALAFSAPVVFRTAPSREAAGLIFGSMLRAFSRLEVLWAALAVAGLAISWNRPVAKVDLFRGVLLAVMVLVLVALQVWILPALESLRPEMAGSNDARDRFQSLHRISEHLYKVTLVCGMALIAISAWTSRRPA